MTPAADPHKRWLRRLIGYCWRYPRLVTFALLGSLVATVVAVIIVGLVVGAALSARALGGQVGVRE